MTGQKQHFLFRKRWQANGSFHLRGLRPAGMHLLTCGQVGTVKLLGILCSYIYVCGYVYVYTYVDILLSVRDSGHCLCNPAEGAEQRVVNVWLTAQQCQ